MDKPDEQLVRQLKAYQAGANVHTVNKARCYYTWWKTNPSRRLKLDGMIREALVNHDWSTLRLYMRRWF